MARLEDLTIGSVVTGLLPNEPITVVSTKWYGSTCIDVIYKTNTGVTGSQVLYRDDEASLSILEKSLPWSFDVPGDRMRLVSEAYRIDLAHLFDPYLAVHTSSIEPLPHQISAVYQEMLPRLPLRYVLADDPGAGKTIMTGLLLKELIVRGDLKRCMIVCPGNLAEQWQDELYQKFHLRFEILTNDRLESSVTGNAFTEINYCIARLDKLARNDELQEKLKITDWDLIVCDEAHKMSASMWGGEIHYTKRYQLGRLLSGITRHFLLLTATPHNGKEEDFQLFMALIDPDRFEGVCRTSNQSIDISDVMRRLVKEDLLKFDGKPLFPERLAYTVNYDLSPMEAQLYNAVTTYVQEEFNRADNLEGEHRNSVGFALTILQRRLASSPEAIYQSLRRRRERLENRLREEKLGRRARETEWQFDIPDDMDDMDDMPADELEKEEEAVAERASAAKTIPELEAEIATLKKLEYMANQVRNSGTDKKWEELSSILQDNELMFGEDGQREKLIIFTEHRDTLNYLADKIRTLFGKQEAVVTIHGGMLRDDRRKIETLFKQDKDVRIMIATDAAGEGINLQRAHLMVNYDLPWNPNRIEQRFGRIHRIGQTEVCHLWNLVSKETREGAVYQRLFEKLEEERNALGGKVFDILGKVSFDNQSLRDLLIEAIRYGNRPEVRAKLNQVVDRALDIQSLQKLIDENALTEDTMDVHKIMAIREEMEQIWARTIKCPNPACGCQMPLTRAFNISKKRGHEAVIVPHVNGNKITYSIQAGKNAVDGTVSRKGARCLFCNSPVEFPYIREQGKKGEMGQELIGIVAEGAHGRLFLPPDDEQIAAANISRPKNYPSSPIPEQALGFRVQLYGMNHFEDVYTNRQLTALVTLSECLPMIREAVLSDALGAGMEEDGIPLNAGGKGASAYADAIIVYLSMLIDQLSNQSSSLCSWHVNNIQMKSTFSRQSLPMVWDYAESNIFCSSSGSMNNMLQMLVEGVQSLTGKSEGIVAQHNAMEPYSQTNIMISTDPPYYDNIGYADLSDYFYLWLRGNISKIYPDVVSTLMAPKGEELIATPFRNNGSMAQARHFFENGMEKAFIEMYKVCRDDIPLTVYYAFKQSENSTEEDIGSEVVASTGWETMLTALINAGFAIVGTWPMRTEMTTGVKTAINVLASSIVLVCRKRDNLARSVTRREFINALHREMRPALEKLQSANIAPVDLAQSAIGPGIGVFSRYKSVLEADGRPMSVRAALQIINQELDAFYNEQEGELDRESRFCVDLFNQYAFNTIKFGDADILARAKNTSVQALADRGVLLASKGQVRLLTREEIPERVSATEECVWLLTQQLARAMEKGGVKECASIVMNLYGSNAENAKALAYRLYTICERKNWAQEGYAYNNLVVAWPDIQAMAADMAAATPIQLSLEDVLNSTQQ